MSDTKESHVAAVAAPDPPAADPTVTIMRLPGFDTSNIGAIIGPKKEACAKNKKIADLPSLRKNVIFPTWNMYNLAKEQGKIDTTRGDPKTPYIRLQKDSDGIFAQITSESPEMIKFVMHNLDLYQKSFKMPKRKMEYTLYANMPQDAISRLIGRNKASLESVREEAISQMDSEVNSEDIEVCHDHNETRIWISPYNPLEEEVRGGRKKGGKRYSSFEEYLSFVEKSNRHDHIGWGPNERDTLVKIYVSSTVCDTAFSNFIDCLSSSFDSRVREITEQIERFDMKKKEDLKQVMGALNTDW